jgi:hypothetical protein
MSDVMAHTYLRGREGGMVVTGRRGRGRKKLLVDLKEKERGNYSNMMNKYCIIYNTL